MSIRSGIPTSAFWAGRPVVVTGGASFIGSHLADALVALGARVTVVDNLSSGLLENIADQVASGAITFHEADLRDAAATERVLAGADTVFHLAAAHGGRGYVDLHQAACAENLYLDGLVFRTALKSGVRKVVYASSGCIYPLHLQGDLSVDLLLTEDLAGPPYDADGMYGHAKLMGELTLRAMHQEYGLKAASCRYFTVYGPRGIENHAVIAMMARALIRQNPFEIWGDGTQVRNWTYVDDIVSGTILAGEHIDDGSAVNLGTTERITVLEAAHMICEMAGYQPEFAFRTDMPTGPVNRIASFERAADILGWQPGTLFAEGVRKTFDWYLAHRDPALLAQNLDQLLTERGVTPGGASTGDIAPDTVPAAV
ncbi:MULTISPECIES: SDR family NAD(P)-dependent oxidoreductase [Kitasatospora]|uniref:GDP-mannose 4,6-dehydratase n=1 Tax=Kitasatospora cystarginea TaxID=58350 RepID=A0ABN3DDQ0_9ACTN